MTHAAGDTVALKSGGPEMTVEDSNDRLTYCVWWDAGEFMRDSFPTAGLKVKATSRLRVVKGDA